MKLEIIQTDITKLKVDAIVNAANRALCGGGGVDGAIHRAAGKNLLEECRTLKGCDTGYAKLTKGYELPAKYVIHTVGPVWDGGHKNEEALLASCYSECISIGEKNTIRSIAFPGISCGACKFPIPLACDIAIKTVLESVESSIINQIVFACLNSNVEQSLKSSLAKYGDYKQ